MSGDPVGVLGPPTGPRGRKRSGTRQLAAAQVPPHDADLVGIEFTDSGSTGADYDAVDQGSDDGIMTGQVEGAPRPG